VFELPSVSCIAHVPFEGKASRRKAGVHLRQAVASSAMQHPDSRGDVLNFSGFNRLKILAPPTG